MDKRDLQTALAHHQAGRLGPAEEIYRDLLSRNPDDADALHLLGALLGQRGDVDEAVGLLRRAIAVKPDYIRAIRNLAALLAGAKRYEESVAAFKSALALAPEDASLHNDVGTVYIAMSRFDDAIASFQAATEFDPIFAPAYKNLSAAFRKSGRLDEAVSAARNAVRIVPSSPDAHFELGLGLARMQKHQEALLEYRDTLRCKPDHWDAYEAMAKSMMALQKLEEAIALLKHATGKNPDRASLFLALGAAAGQANRHGEALAAFQNAARINPDSLEAHVNCATALAELKRLDEATEYLANARAIDPNAAITHEAAGEIAFHQLDVKTAVEHYRDAISANPELISARLGLGKALRAEGKFEEAQAAFREALAIDPSMVGIYGNIVRSGKGVVEGEELNQFMRAMSETDSEERTAANFAMGKIFDEKEQFDEAFEHYEKGNRSARKRHESMGIRYITSSYREMVDQMIDIFTPDFYEQRRGWGNSSSIPVFIVGMPRSGTTLAHQIIASHPRARGGGERSDIAHLAGRLSKGDIRESAEFWSREAITQAADEQMETYRKLIGPCEHLIDKMPNNVMYCGLIALLFPGAHIIFCRRDPRDTCLSCYFQNFDAGITFATDLANCGSHNVQTYRLMDHWLKVLPVKMMELHYESVVADLETQARRLIDFIGLPWDPACLNYREAKTAVLTASVWQVRQPIYNSSVGRWRHYQRHLGPLFTELEKLGNI
jgi:tetratricopeptide (TPR) repeat protein